VFSLVHFSRVFPYIHPYLFPIETAKPAGPAMVQGGAQPLPGTGAAVAIANPSEAATSARSVQGKHLKSLHRRHLRNQRNETLTYSGAFRRAACQ
jgi:hypothetical protein